VVTFAVTNTTAEAVTFTATDSTDAIQITQTQTVTFDPGAATKLGFPGQPTNGTAGSNLATFTVAVQDANSNTVTTDSSTTVTLTLNSGSFASASSTYQGVAVSSGVATFSTVRIDVAGTYTITANSSPTYTAATSSSFSRPSSNASSRHASSPSRRKPLIATAATSKQLSPAIRTIERALGEYIGICNPNQAASIAASRAMSAFSALRAVSSLVPYP